ncbi:PR domain zinc finger protein 15-like [Hydra vulgaris]|uniref:PR domain zinc finger protein 15-like n=1 Tax=Hydra vulgaris TaxID=6087 RepID=UPI0032E9F41C
MTEAENIKSKLPDFPEMSKIGSERWKALHDSERKEWNKKGQLMREEEDCGLVEMLASPSGTRSFKKGSEYRYHIKNCVESKCDKCDKVFVNKIQLKKHYLKHTGSVCCDVCLKIFSGQQALKRHKASLHDNLKFECSDCKKHFSTKGNMSRHKKLHKI